MARKSLKSREATITITAYDGRGDILDKMGATTRLTPSMLLLEFMFLVEERYPSVTRYEMTVAY